MRSERNFVIESPQNGVEVRPTRTSQFALRQRPVKRWISVKFSTVMWQNSRPRVVPVRWSWGCVVRPDLGGRNLNSLNVLKGFKLGPPVRSTFASCKPPVSPIPTTSLPRTFFAFLPNLSISALTHRGRFTPSLVFDMGATHGNDAPPAPVALKG